MDIFEGKSTDTLQLNGIFTNTVTNIHRIHNISKEAYE